MVHEKDRTSAHSASLICRVFNWIKESPDRFSHFMFVISGVVSVVLGFYIFASCLSRYFYSKPFTGIYEVSGYGLYILTFLAIPFLLKKDKHVSIDALVELFPPKVKDAIKVFQNILCLVMGVLLFYYSTVLTINLYKSGIRLFDTLEPPKYILMIFVPLCFLPFSLIALKKVYASIKTLIKPEEKQESIGENA